MSGAPKQIQPKASEDEEELSPADLEILHGRLAALRAADGAEECAEEKERKSVRALIACAACDLGVNEEVVRALVEHRFGGDVFSNLAEERYDELARFLENPDVKRLIN
jgi:hypothetical protein